jgi:chromate reductase
MYIIVSSTNRPNNNSIITSRFYSSLLTKKGIENEIIDLQDLPDDFTCSALYENTGKNLQFNKLKNKLEKATKIIFVIPEYNGSFPGVLKSFIDGLSYPNGIKGNKAALVGISSGDLGSHSAMSHFTDILNYMGCHIFANKVRVPFIEKHIEKEVLYTTKIHERIENQIDSFIEF